MQSVLRHKVAFIAVLLLAALGQDVNAAIHYVNRNLSTGANDGTSWSDAFQGALGLQNALAIVQPGDQIWVAAGMYAPGAPDDITATFHLLNGVTIYGGFHGDESELSQRNVQAHQTILTGDVGFDDVYGSPIWYIGWNIHSPNSEHVVTASGVDESAVLDGFTITAGRGGFGGGMYNISGSPAINNCTFLRNMAGFASGGGVYNSDANPSFSSCVFIQNWSHMGHGAAMENQGSSSVSIVDCEFLENRCIGSSPEAAGGAIEHWATGSLAIANSTFTGNLAQNLYPSGGTSGSYGGAIHHFSGTMTIVNCRFDSNFGNAGGAIWTWANATIANCQFRGNQAPEYQAMQGGWGGVGGAIGASSFATPWLNIINCTIVGNTAKRGGGIRLLQGHVENLVNCIVWGNIDEFGSIGPSQISGAKASYCDIQNMLIGIPGEDPPDPADFPNCIDANPMFVNMSTGDLHLQPFSPCIDEGNSAAVPMAISTDLDGLPRFADGDADTIVVVDMGAFELQPSIPCPADVNQNGVVDVVDLLSVINAWGSPGGPTDIDGNGSVGVGDLLALINAWGPC